LTQQKQVPGDPIVKSNGLEASLTNLKGVELDVARMGLDPRQPLKLHVVSDGQTDVTLLGNFGIVAAGPLPVAGTGGRVVITFPAGTTDATVAPR
jgi:hypothetical protein